MLTFVSGRHLYYSAENGIWQQRLLSRLAGKRLELPGALASGRSDLRPRLRGQVFLAGIGDRVLPARVVRPIPSRSLGRSGYGTSSPARLV
jgi:hypothetical protein